MCRWPPGDKKKNHHSLYTVNELLNFSSCAVKMVQWVKGFAAKPDDMGLFPEPKWYKDRTDSSKLSSPTIVCVLTHACTHACAHTHNVKNTVKIFQNFSLCSRLIPPLEISCLIFLILNHVSLTDSLSQELRTCYLFGGHYLQIAVGEPGLEVRFIFLIS